MIQFDLKPSKDENPPFIELNRLLKAVNLCGSGAEANQFILEGLVEVNGKVDTRKRAKLRSGDKISFNGEEIEIL